MLSQKCAIILPIRQEQESLFKLSETSIKKAINNSKGTFSQISTLNIKVENIGEGCDYSKTLNKGVKMAQSDGCDWVFFLNCGDIVVPDIFKNVAPYLSSYDAVWGQIYTYKVGSGSKIMAEKDLKQLEWTDNKKDTLLIDPHINIQIGHFVKTSIASSNPFNEKIMAGEDFEYCLHIWENYKCIKIPRPLYCKRHSMYLNSQQSTYNQQRMTTASSILEEYKNAKINNLYTTKGDKEKYYMDVAIYGIMRSGTTILSDMLTVKDKSIILHEPEVMYTHYKKSNFEKLGHKRMFTQLQEFGFNVSEIKIWDRVKYPSFIQFFDSKIYPLLSHLKTWGVKMVYFDNWEGFLAAYQPQKLILCVRDIRDVVLSEFDLAIRLNNLVADESWMEKRIIESCKQLVKMSKLNHYFLARYEDLCSNPDVKWQAAQYVGLKELGNERPSFEKISPFRKYELEKHGNGISNSSIYRHRSEPFGPALALANHVWRSCPE